MQRRHFFKALAAISVTAKTLWGQQVIAPAPQTTTMKMAEPPSAWRLPVQTKIGPIPLEVPDAVAQTKTHFFSNEQLATLRKLSEILMPPLDGYPGATQAGAPEFIDFLIGVSPVERRQMYQTGLNQLNSEAKKRFGAPFSEVTAPEADTLIRPWLAAWMPDQPPAEPYARFINLAHRDIRMATINSQAWSTAAAAAGERAPGVDLYWSPVDPDIQMYV